MTDALVQFLRARLVEDEQAACAAAWDEDLSTKWQAAASSRSVRTPASRWFIQDAYNDGVLCDVDEGVARHIARHDPARTLAEVDAKRQVLRRLEEAKFTLGVTEKGTPPHDLMTGAVSSWRQAVQLLALPYSDHPDYRTGWAPGG